MDFSLLDKIIIDYTEIRRNRIIPNPVFLNRLIFFLLFYIDSTKQYVVC